MMRSIRLVAVGVLTVASMSGCGMWQSLKDTTVDTTRAVFIAKVKQMNLVIESRSALNENEQG
jgi:type VI secretion system protein VasD